MVGTVQKGHSGTKIFWVALRHRGPQLKCKKVSGTKMELNCSGTKIPVELKIASELKFGGGPLGDKDSRRVQKGQWN